MLSVDIDPIKKRVRKGFQRLCKIGFVDLHASFERWIFTHFARAWFDEFIDEMQFLWIGNAENFQKSP